MELRIDWLLGNEGWIAKCDAPRFRLRATPTRAFVSCGPVRIEVAARSADDAKHIALEWVAKALEWRAARE
jgi:hypothetical protein